MVKLSVVAPNLNEAKYLPAFLASLELQTFKDWELIVVDGGSTDGSLHILRSFKKAKVVIDKTRNIGYIRNVGAKHAQAPIIFHTSSDVILPSNLLTEIFATFQNEDCVALMGRTYPIGTSILAYFGYVGFDILRCVFAKTKMKFRPPGNFCVVKKAVFDSVGGFPEVKINEDGLFGYKLDLYCKQTGTCAKFKFNLVIRHNVKRFEKKGSLKTLLFYIYVLSNMFPMLKFLTKHIEYKSGLAFASRSDWR
ncbi:MAG: glycosyltransferase family 2 protein [Candidatus Bathycorpusculaceae bacterium]